MKNDYYYLVTIDPINTLRGGVQGKYKRELEDFLGQYRCTDAKRFALTKEQLALFFYLRCRMGGSNGVKDLDMRRATGEVERGAIDLRGASTNGGEDEPKKHNAVELAQQLATVDKLLNQLDRHEPIQLINIALNSDHMRKVLEVQRAELRAKIVATVSVRA